MADEAQRVDGIHSRRDSRARSGDLPLVHGTGALSSGARFLQFRTLQDWAPRRLLYQRQRRFAFRSADGATVPAKSGNGSASRMVLVSSNRARTMGRSRVMFSRLRVPTMPEFFAALRYRIVEPFPVLRARQKATLESFRLENRVGGINRTAGAVHWRPFLKRADRCDAGSSRQRVEQRMARRNM